MIAPQNFYLHSDTLQLCEESPTHNLSASSCLHHFWAPKHRVFFSSTFLLHHPHVTCLPGHSCPVLSSLCLLLESCLNKVTFIHEWVSMTTRPQDFLSRRPPWCDGYRKKPKGEHRCSRATSVALIIALWAKI